MSEEIQHGALYVVSTPIGNLDDITLRAVRILGSVDCIAAEDTRTTKVLLDHLGIRKPLVSYYSYNEQRRAASLIAALRQGSSVAVVTDAGTPGISDPAYVLIREAVEAGIAVIASPGPSALLAALVVSGLPADRFVFEGFLPVKKGRKTRFEALAGETRTIVIYESPHRIEKTLNEVLQFMGDRQVALVRELTKKFEEVRRGPVSRVSREVGGRPPRGEYVLVIAGTSYRHGALSAQEDES
ncbi:MAG TPA: 16S rRNA (cytidine(1402)-2'-O)-methyltransferase [Bacteroidota bacterium]|nr:16S rRNA (cytidine(1402)-2'-O)-methyltransferase [Bacteroidota bacterium]